MEISSNTFREVEFREKRHGYHPEDVDHFLERMAVGMDALQDRLRRTTERAERAEEFGSAGSSDETLRRTLVLAQRTADAAVKDAQERAEEILASAAEQARVAVAGAEERVHLLQDESLTDIRDELIRLESARSRAQEEVDALHRWAEENRAHLTLTLRDAIAAVDRTGTLVPPPASTPIQLGMAGRVDEAATVRSGSPAAPGRNGDISGEGPSTPPATDGDADALPSADGGIGPSASPDEAVTSSVAASSVAASSVTAANGPVMAPAPPVPGDRVAVNGGGPDSATIDLSEHATGLTERNLLTDPDETAIDNFFDDSADEDHRLGGRLRRRR